MAKPSRDGPVRDGDRPCASVKLSGPERLGAGFRKYESFSVAMRDRTGGTTTFDREIVRSGSVVGILAVDPERSMVVLTRQFRLGTHLALGYGEAVEIAAGAVEAGEDLAHAAQRECREELGLEPERLVPLFSLAPAPALSDELMTLFLARIDARQVPDWAGAAHEQEEIAVERYTIAEAIDLVARMALHSGPTIIAL